MSENIEITASKTLTDQLRELAEARRELASRQDREFRAHEIVAEDSNFQAWQAMIADRREQEQHVTSLEGDVRCAAVESYLDTGDKAPAPGITIKTFSRLEYDQVAATNWCRGIMPGLLTLDTKRFERMASQDMLPGAPVEIVKEPRATIATDLSSYLTE
jgi:hypothetical protein